MVDREDSVDGESSVGVRPKEEVGMNCDRITRGFQDAFASPSGFEFRRTDFERNISKVPEFLDSLSKHCIQPTTPFYQRRRRRSVMALAASNVMPSGQRHVPAWKRIGLKLKYAKDSAEIHSLEPHTPENSGIATGDHVRPPKKRKIDAGSVRNEEDSKTTRSAGDSIIGPDLNSENA